MFICLKQGGSDMKSPSVSCISKTLLSILFVACLMLTPSMVWAQDKSSELTDEEYKIYEDVKAEKDQAKKVDLIAKGLQEKSQGNLRKYLVPEFQQIMAGLLNENKWTQVIALGEKFLNASPNDKYTIEAVAAACGKTGNTKGIATYGEKLYAFRPSPELANEIAQAYQKIGNEAKYTQWKEKVVAADPDNLQNLADVTKKHMINQNKPQAIKYAKKIISILPTAKKPGNVDEATWKNIISNAGAIAYGVIGSDAFENRRYAEAITNLNNAVKYYKNNETAYFYLGQAYWQSNQMQPAMLNFAKAYVLKGSTSASAKKLLEQLWANTHRGSLAGVNSIIERASQDLK
jgi:tetratricopeptide (TPR) repeat protein